MDSVRIDKWLWAARFFKTRSLATDAVDNGRVRLDGERIKPARAVKLGDQLHVDNGADRWDIEVIQIYDETAASVARREVLRESRRLYPEPGSTIKGRPTKRDRRAIAKIGE